MVDTKFSDYPINFLLIGLFLIAVIGFGSNLASHYDEDRSFITSDKIDMDRLEAQINDTSNDAEAWGDSFRSDNLFVSLGNIVLFSIWGVMKLIWISVLSIWTILSDGARAVLGIPAIVMGVILAIIILGLIFSAWKAIKSGEG